MPKPKLLIIVLYQNLSDRQITYNFSLTPPLSGILVAGLTPPIVEVEVLHEMVRPIDYDTDADFVALSFMDFCAPHAFDVARRFRQLGKTVIAGGRYPTTFHDKVLPHFDAIVVGEAEHVWPRVVEDMLRGKLEKLYEAPFGPPLDNIPPPRYDLVEKNFSVPIVTEATRGCNHRCSFCQLTIKPSPYRCRPIEDVIRDLTSTAALPFHKRRMAMFLDNNLGSNIGYAKELLAEVAKLKLWGLGVQFSFDCLQDDEFVERLVAANCRMAFIGLESLNEPSLLSVHKMHNKVNEYQMLFAKLKRHGILTFTGLMLALDEDTTDYFDALPDNLNRIDPSSILLALAIPIHGTGFHQQVEAEGRIVDRDLSHYDGYHLVFRPKQVTAEDVKKAYVRINERYYSWKSIFKRWCRFMLMQSRKGGLFRRIFGFFVVSVAFFKLSSFQRNFGRKKVETLFPPGR